MFCHTGAFGTEADTCYQDYLSLALMSPDVLDPLSLDDAETLLQLDQLIAFACRDGNNHEAERLILSLQNRLHSGTHF